MKFRSLLFMIAVVVLLSSCLDDDDGYVNEPIELAYVSIYHAAPDAPDFDIVVDGRVINNTPFDYTSYTGYMNFFTGAREIRFNAVNANSSLIDTTFNLENGKAYSLFAVNTVPNVEALLVVDSAATPSAGKAMVRFVNLSPDAPAFTVSADGTTPLFAEQPFKHASEFKEIDAGRYDFDVRDTDDTDLVAARGVDLVAGKYYTIVTRGFINPPAGNTHVLSVELLD